MLSRLPRPIKNALRPIKRWITLKRPAVRDMSYFFGEGFHGDRYLLNYIDQLMPHVKTFVETGADVGITLRYVAATYPHVQVFSCEPDDEVYTVAMRNLGDMAEKVSFLKMFSPEFLYQIHSDYPTLMQSRNLYWLDAHSYGFQWPLYDEIRFITSKLPTAYIMIDDTEIPGQPQFKFSNFKNQVLNQEYLVNALAPGRTYHVVTPLYTEHTSSYHPLVGVTLIAFGDGIVDLPQDENFHQEIVTK